VFAYRSAILLLFFAGCDSPPSPSGQEWTPKDHDRSEEKQRVQNGQQSPEQQGSPDNGQTLVEITWQQSCFQCHGSYGHGDGPQGPMVKAPDLTREEWQARVTDAEIAERIRSGKGAMPRFDLPPQVIQGIVGRIRAYRGLKEQP
jgi:cytochrome c oxidase cbb3-type subunit 3